MKEKSCISCNIGIKKEIGEMQDFIAKLLEKSTFSRCNFQIHEKIQSQYSTFDTLFLKKKWQLDNFW